MKIQESGYSGHERKKSGERTYWLITRIKRGNEGKREGLALFFFFNFLMTNRNGHSSYARRKIRNGNQNIKMYLNEL